jgi:hypothetical protein
MFDKRRKQRRLLPTLESLDRREVPATVAIGAPSAIQTVQATLQQRREELQARRQEAAALRAATLQNLRGQRAAALAFRASVRANGNPATTGNTLPFSPGANSPVSAQRLAALQATARTSANLGTAGQGTAASLLANPTLASMLNSTDPNVRAALNALAGVSSLVATGSLGLGSTTPIAPALATTGGSSLVASPTTGQTGSFLGASPTALLGGPFFGPSPSSNLGGGFFDASPSFNFGGSFFDASPSSLLGGSTFFDASPAFNPGASFFGPSPTTGLGGGTPFI